METCLYEPIEKVRKLPRYFFEQYMMTQTTFRTVTHFVDDDDEEDVGSYEEYEEEKTLGYWAVYDRKVGHGEPIAYTHTADVAQKIIDALNR